jgi:hypothetical protein
VCFFFRRVSSFVPPAAVVFFFPLSNSFFPVLSLCSATTKPCVTDVRVSAATKQEEILGPGCCCCDFHDRARSSRALVVGRRRCGASVGRTASSSTRCRRADREQRRGATRAAAAAATALPGFLGCRSRALPTTPTPTPTPHARRRWGLRRGRARALFLAPPCRKGARGGSWGDWASRPRARRAVWGDGRAKSRRG